MASVRVTFEAYQQGRLPPVCVLSGEPADATLRLLTPIDDSGHGGFLGLLTGFVHRVDARRPRDLLLGRLPVSLQAREEMIRRRKLSSGMVSGGVLGLGVAAYAGAAWSPPVALVAVIVLARGGWQRRSWRRALPRPVLVDGGATVVLGNVHEGFAAAVRSQWTR